MDGEENGGRGIAEVLDYEVGPPDTIQLHQVWGDACCRDRHLGPAPLCPCPAGPPNSFFGAPGSIISTNMNAANASPTSVIASPFATTYVSIQDHVAVRGDLGKRLAQLLDDPSR